MSESTLALKKADFESKVGVFFGWGRGEEAGDEAWDSRKESTIRDCVESGLRQFYFPAPQGGVPHDWSFLKPVATVALASGETTIALPDDFGGLEGSITVLSPTQSTSWTIPLLNEGIVRERYSSDPAQTGTPAIASLQPLRSVGNKTEGQRLQMFIFPAADRDYELQFAYYILPNFLDGTHPYAYGGVAHAETILESCLAIAEQRYDDTSSVHSEKFQERLAASISYDRKLKPQSGGRNSDRFDETLNRRPWRREAVVTYNGQEW